MAATTLNPAFAIEREETIPWYLWAGLIATTSAVLGGQWYISWHRSIGRDTFWTPAHMAIYLCGVIAGFGGGAVTLLRTFGPRDAQRESTVGLWGFRAPLGIFLCIWGAVAMLTSAPFDNWWHNAYGLDVKIVSPPHTLLSLGSLSIKIGLMALLAGLMSRASDSVRRTLGLLLLYMGAVCVAQMGTILTTSTWPTEMHSAACYLAVAVAIPAVLIAPAWGSQLRWGCTAVAGIYTAILLAFEWI